MIWRFTLFVAFLIVTIEAKKYPQPWQERGHEQWREFEEFLEWKKAKKLQEYRLPEIKYEKLQSENHDVDQVYEKNQQAPPPIDEAALMARYIVNQAGKDNGCIYILELMLIR